MSDDSPFPPNKSGHHPHSLANLRPSKPGDPSRNPTGKNGRTRAERLAKILDGAAITPIELAMVKKLGLPEDTPLIDALVHREVIAGLGKSDAARKGLREAYAGRPRQQVDLSSEDGSMSPMGPDSVVDSLRAAIEARRSRVTAEAPEQQGAPSDDPAGAK